MYGIHRSEQKANEKRDVDESIVPSRIGLKWNQTLNFMNEHNITLESRWCRWTLALDFRSLVGEETGYAGS